MLYIAHTLAFAASTRLATAPMPDGRPSVRELVLAWGWEAFKQQFNF